MNPKAENHEVLEARAELWALIDTKILADLERVGAGQLDEFDLAEYHAVLEPLEVAVMGGSVPTMDSEAVRSVRRAIRDSQFRPTYSEVQGMVRAALGIAPPALLEGRDADARRAVRMPLALPPHPDNPGRRAFEAKRQEMRWKLAKEAEEAKLAEGGSDDFAFPPVGLREMPWPGDEDEALA